MWNADQSPSQPGCKCVPVIPYFSGFAYTWVPGRGTNRNKDTLAMLAASSVRSLMVSSVVWSFSPGNPWMINTFAAIPASAAAWTAARILLCVVFFRMAFNSRSLPDSMPYLTSIHPDAAIFASSGGSTVSTRDRADQRRPRPVMWSQISATFALLTMKLSSTIAKPWMP